MIPWTSSDRTRRDASPIAAGGWHMMRRRARPTLGFLLAFYLVLAAAPALGVTNENDLTIAARALGFLSKPPSGVLRVGIVYAPDSPQSIGDTAALRKIMGSGLNVGGMSLTAVLVPIDDVGAANVDLLFLAQGAGSRASKVGDAGGMRQLPCVTLDIDQVKNGNCPIGIKSEPRVEILVNREAAARNGIVFAGAFRMLITEF